MTIFLIPLSSSDYHSAKLPFLGNNGIFSQIHLQASYISGKKST